MLEIPDTEVMRALSKLKNGKAPGTSDFKIEMISY